MKPLPGVPRARSCSSNGLRALSILATAALLAVTSSAEVAAQDRYWSFLSYQSAISAQNTRDIVDATSWRNIALEGRGFVSPRITVGGYAGWNVFYQDKAGTVSLGGVDITGRQNRFVNAIPLLLTSHYYLGSDTRRSTRFFLGGGVGAYWIESRLEVGLTSVTVDNWHFGLAPEVGAYIPVDPGFGFILSVKYNHAFEREGLTQGYWTFGVGVGGGA